MTGVRIDGGGEPRLQSVPLVPDALSGLEARPGSAVRPDLAARPGLEARPGLLTLVAAGGAPVCEGDSCFVPGAEGAWAEVPD
ncbi:hypothetical protein [Curtobacterium pusillum]|uniref:hypothetical protein n=1 Tax=Curtobacterium pusillum TaxID=69373 RepID=UPI0011A9E7A7|nr:hypothetical protein [Curtobacterium pusillum]